jgi:hypothetical protein
MANRAIIAKQTRNNWLIDAALFTGAIVSMLTGIYFLFLPVGGYQGGRNPMYGITFLFERHTWEDLHTWFGIGMIVAALIHLVIHWNWIVSMIRRVTHEMIHRQRRLNARGRANLALNSVVGFSFLLTALSGLYFYFFPGGSSGLPDPGLLFTRLTWDLLHTWAGITLIGAAVVHFAIHWKWVTKVTAKMLKAILPSASLERQEQPVEVSNS